MKLRVYSIYDEKAQAYLEPVYFNHVGEVVRMFTSVVNNPKSNISLYPEDYTLYQLGEYDNVAGVFNNLKAPLFVARATDLKKVDNQMEMPLEDKRKERVQ
jgi:hypothetical protein